MNKKVLSVVSILALSALVGCNNGKNPSESSQSIDDTSASESMPTSSSSEEKELYLNVTQRKSFSNWNTAKNANPSSISGFYDREQPYTVGDDNEFQIEPTVTVMDEDMNTYTGAKSWPDGFTIKVVDVTTEQEVGDDIYEVTDEINLKIKFKEAAIGNSYNVIVIPNNDPKASTNTQSKVVKVIDGYNVYKAIELGLIDTRENVSDETHEHYDYDNIYLNWKGLLEENGVATKTESGEWIEPSCMILQDDIKITPNDIPSKYIYTKEEANKAGNASLEGSLKDWSQLYFRTENPWYQGTEPLPGKTFTMEGNYYKMDFSNVPLVKRDSDGDTITPISHAGVFYIEEGSLNLRNINVTGNAPKQEDAKYGGGLIFCKACERAREVNVYNTLNRSSFISYMSSESKEKQGYTPVDFNIDKAKCSDGYNSFLYNWAGTMDIRNSYFNGCGGPVVIQDHHYNGESTTNYDLDEDGVNYLGVAAKTTFTDCTLENYVGGTEAWFESFGATGIVGTIKSLSAFFNKVGLTYVYDKDHNPTAYSSGETLLNFITVHKCAEAQGITNNAVSGEVKIINTEEGSQEVFNYGRYTVEERQAMAQKVQKYTADLMAIQADPTDMEYVAAVIADCATEGIEVNQETLDQNELLRIIGLLQKRTVHIGVELNSHKLIRQGNAQGAPVYQTGTSYGLYANGNDILVPNVADGGSTNVPVTTNDDFVTGCGKYLSLYYNGMMIILGAGRLPL